MSTMLPTRQLDDTEEFLTLLRSTPLRSIEDIAADREPVTELPVVAAGMQREVPEPEHYRGHHRRAFRGPSLWRLRSWVLWNFGDLVHWRRLYEQQQHPYRMV